jgi:hypothetical protein
MLVSHRFGSRRGQEGMGQQGQRDVAIPGVPATDLILIQAHIILGALEALFDAPVETSHPRQVSQRRRRWTITDVQRELVCPTLDN